MEYEIRGADSRTGKNITIRIDAESDVAAEEAANSLGVLVTSVERLEQVISREAASRPIEPRESNVPRTTGNPPPLPLARPIDWTFHPVTPLPEPENAGGDPVPLKKDQARMLAMIGSYVVLAISIANILSLSWSGNAAEDVGRVFGAGFPVLGAGSCLEFYRTGQWRRTARLLNFAVGGLSFIMLIWTVYAKSLSRHPEFPFLHVTALLIVFSASVANLIGLMTSNLTAQPLKTDL